MSSTSRHLHDVQVALAQLTAGMARIDEWGDKIGRVLATGGRLLAVGNGGSAAQSEHLTAELVGRFDGERRPLAAIAVGAEYAATTAIVNDYGIEAAFVRPVCAHGRPGDVIVALSTSGRSSNVLAAVRAAHDIGMSSLALTGPSPNPLADLCDDAVVVMADRTATIQEVHQVVIHLLCLGIDRAVRSGDHVEQTA